jgi:PPM family protein phosphatase
VAAERSESEALTPPGPGTPPPLAPLSEAGELPTLGGDPDPTGVALPADAPPADPAALPADAPPDDRAASPLDAPRADPAAAPAASPVVQGHDAEAEADGGNASTEPGGIEPDRLEELLLPSSVQPPLALAPGTMLGPEGEIRVDRFLGARGRTNRYAATMRDAAGAEAAIELREAPADDAGITREAEVLERTHYAMLPRLRAAFVAPDGTRYLALEAPGQGQTLAQALQAGLPPDQAVGVVLQLAQAVRRLHQAGWALIGLAPSDVVLGDPLRLMQLGSAIPIGETPLEARHVAGYSAPELAHRAPVTGKEDVYTLGAVLYHALARQPLPESGAELGGLSSVIQTPGAPQLLASALAPDDERIDLDELYRMLLELKQRVADVTWSLQVATATTVGLNPTRTTNEDSCGFLVWSAAGAEGLSQRALLCVADGMGGMEAGEVASATALQTIMAGALEPDIDPVALIRRAAPAVHAAGQGRQMGTTATCVQVADGTLTLGHVGDTRAYLLRDGVLTQLTADHSLVAAMVASGVLSKAEARGHPDSNKVLRSLGSQRELPDGYVDGLEAAFDRPSLQLRAGDRLLLCSDGVWGMVEDDQIRTILSEALDAPTAANVLVDRALQAGAPDNATALVARCVPVRAR